MKVKSKSNEVFGVQRKCLRCPTEVSSLSKGKCLHRPMEKYSVSNPIQRLQHDDRVSADDHHSDRLLISVLFLLDGFVDDEIHEGIVTAQNARQRTSAVDLKGQSLVHELLQFGRMSLRHFERDGLVVFPPKWTEKTKRERESLSEMR